MLEQEEGDLSPTHVRRGAEAGLPVARAPVPGGIHESRLFGRSELDDVRSPCALATKD